MDRPARPADYYQEQHRPQFHFSPEAHWMNDPNGMVFYDGEYHLFYQYYPDSTVWGPMHWGHAVSNDLVFWEHLPIALYPDSLGYIFSGGAVVDWKNTSGFGKEGKPPLVAFFTHHKMEWEKAGRNDFQYQSLAYSNDKGRTWTKYEGNPIVGNPTSIRDFRDPNVVWDEVNQQWIMVLAAGSYTQFWVSKDIKEWTQTSDFGMQHGVHDCLWECPDFFPIQVTGGEETKWVLLQNINAGGSNGGSSLQYFVGDWDGKTFTLDAEFEKDVPLGKGVFLDYGRDNYAGVTWSDVPKSDGRRIFLGWMSNWDYAQIVPTSTWRSAMTLPRELGLFKTEQGYRLFAQPVGELENLFGKKFTWSPKDFTGSFNFKETGLNTTLSHIYAEFQPEKSTRLSIVLKNTKGEEYTVGYDAATRQYFSDRRQSGKVGFSEKFASSIHDAPRYRTDEKVVFEAYFDRASCELFADGGRVNLTDIFFPNEDFTELLIQTENGGLFGKSTFVVSELKSIW